MNNHKQQPKQGQRSKQPRPKLVAAVKPQRGPLDLGPNAPVAFDLSKFIDKLFVKTLDVGVYFKGPGPLKLVWGFEYLDEAVGHSPHFLTCDAAYQRLYAIRYLSQELLSKYDDGRASDLKRTTAVARFEQAEEMCRVTNERFQASKTGVPLWANPRKRTPWMDPVSGIIYSAECLAVMRAAKLGLAKLLKYDAELVNRHMYFAGHGPGATTRLPRSRAHQTSKWGGTPHVAGKSVTFVSQFLENNPGYAAAGAGMFVYPGNHVTWVPKNYKTDRTIAIEPEWNMLYQKCVAHYLRQRLKTVGINLRDQSPNAKAAETAVIDQVATVDMSMASDTVSLGLCQYLLPAWLFEHVEQARSPVGLILEGREALFVPDGLGGFTLSNGRTVSYEKVSSMGNGNTFELETTLFYALARATCDVLSLEDASVLVYGDDVVLPSAAWPLFQEVLGFAGFIPNDDKTHADGPFRESCGAHYWCGTDVTPFYVREDVDRLDRLFLLHNNVWRWFQRNPGICEPQKVRDLLAWVRSHAPESWRHPRLPNGAVGDGAFIGKPRLCATVSQFWDQVRELKTTRRYQGWEGWGVNTLQFESKSDRLLDDCEHGDGKAIFAAIWNGTRYETAKDGKHVTDTEHDDLSSVYSDIPWRQRYWTVGVQVFPTWDVSSWF